MLHQERLGLVCLVEGELVGLEVVERAWERLLAEDETDLVEVEC